MSGFPFCIIHPLVPIPRQLNLVHILRLKFTSREADEICAFMGYYAASSGSFLPTFRDELSVPPSAVKGFLTPEGGTDNLSREIGMTFLPLPA